MSSVPLCCQIWTHLLSVPQDPIETIRVKCEETAHCVHTKERLELCEARVSSRSNTEEDCTEELFDFLHARDHCVRSRLQNVIHIHVLSSTCWGLYSLVLQVSHKLFHNVKWPPSPHSTVKCVTASKCKVIGAVQFIFLLLSCKLISKLHFPYAQQTGRQPFRLLPLVWRERVDCCGCVQICLKFWFDDKAALLR